MLNWIILSSITVVILIVFYNVQLVESCNEAVCGSVVSKCLLTQACKCNQNSTSCSCCKDCAYCLSYLYSECCSCVDICPKANQTETSLSKKSHVEDLPDGGIPALFNAITDLDDPKRQWDVFTFPIDIHQSDSGHKKQIKILKQSAEQEVVEEKNKILTLNCTVVYWTQCMSWPKCKQNCVSLGSSSYRWFHDGCCECVGNSCINYGSDESRCKKCSLNDETGEEEDDNLDDLVYDDDDDDNSDVNVNS